MPKPPPKPVKKPAAPPQRGAPKGPRKPPQQAQQPPQQLGAQMQPPGPQMPPGVPPMAGGMPSMQQGMASGAMVLPQPAQDDTTAPGQPAPGQQMPSAGGAIALQSITKGKAKADAKKADPNTPRPEVPQRTRDQVETWWTRTTNLTQRDNALWDYREAQKALFPARFDVTDPRRGQTPRELKNGRDTRRVHINRIYRDSLQTCALTVPDDLDFRWTAVPQAEPPSNPLMPTSMALDPITPNFGKTLSIVERSLLLEAGLKPKFKAWVQDASLFPNGILKFSFRREFSSTYLNAAPPDVDVTDAAAKLEALMQSYALKEFDENAAEFKDMLDLTRSLQQNVRLSRWFGVDLQVLPTDAFGISEDVENVNIYDAEFMFHDALITGEELLKRYPYNGQADGNGDTYGINADELTNAQPWDADNSTTDPNSKNRASRNRQNTAPKPMSGQSSVQTKTTDPKKRKFLVRELWHKKSRTVYTMLKGLKHYLEVRVPQKTSERWYPFAILSPNRVPTENYAASDLSLKKDIQDRMNRKRTDEEKARWLSLDRLIFNTAAIDEKEVVKLGDIPPGQARGLNLGSPSAKMSDAVMTFAYKFNAEAFDTSRDERDLDMMGALPVQATGATGVANFSSEVDTAVQGAAAAVKQRQGIVRNEIEGMLHCLAEILLQELTPDEAKRIAGPYAFWPTIYDEAEAQHIVDQMKAAAVQQVAPQVMASASQAAMAGMPIDPTAIQAQLEQLAAPLWQSMMVEQYGDTEPVTRETVYRRLRVQVTSTLLSTMDRQSRIQSVTLLAQAVMQMTQAAQLAGIPFNPRVLIKKAAMLLDDTEDFDEMFPAVSPLQMAQQQAVAGAPGAPGAPTDAGGPPGAPPQGGGNAPAPNGGPPQAQGNQPNQAPPSVKSAGATARGGRPSPARAASGAPRPG